MAACLIQTPTGALQAAEKLAVSAKEYSLPVEELPQSVKGKVYAKLHDTKKDASIYQLALYDSYDALIDVENALEQAGEKLAEIEYLAMDVALYESDEEGDYYPVEDAVAATVICPVPEEFADAAKKLQVVAVSTAGKLERIESSLVTVGATDCVKFDVYSGKVYAFLVKESGTLTSGTKVTPTPTPKPEKTPTPTPAPTKKPEKTPTPEPTKKPAATVKPTAAPQPTKAVNTVVNTDKKPTSTPKPEKTLTPIPTKKPAATVAPEKDKTPQTGDDFQTTAPIVMLCAGAMICAGSVIIGKRSAKEKEC